jgi:hypothetical protein
MADEFDADSARPQSRSTALVCTSPRPNRRTSRTAFKGEKPARGDPLLGFKPYRHRAPRGNSINPDKQVAFIAELAATGVVTQAARSIGVSLEALYKLRHRKGAEGFAKAWEMALDRGIARLEDCALERAMTGEERAFYRGGEVVARFTHHDNSLLMFLLKQRRRERYDASLSSSTTLWPGHPAYERLRREWEAEKKAQSAAEAAVVLESIDRKLGQMRQRHLAEQARSAALEAGNLVDDEAFDGEVATGAVR